MYKNHESRRKALREGGGEPNRKGENQSQKNTIEKGEGQEDVERRKGRISQSEIYMKISYEN